MELEYDKEADTAYIYLKKDIKSGEVKNTISISGTINLDFDKNKKLLGIEILHASKNISKADILKNVAT